MILKGGKHMNKKGFTLIEIIVSIAIGAIVLLVVGSLLVDSIHFFSSVSYSDIDKRALDSIVLQIRTEVEYAGDVRLMLYNDSRAPEVSSKSDWHCFYVKDNVLYRDDKQLYSLSFYNNRKLEIIAKGNYQNKARVDLTYQFLDESNENVYSSRDTIMFLNIESSKEIMDNGLFNKDSNVKLTDVVTEDKTGYALYYKKGIKIKDINDDPDPSTNSGAGTVAEIQNNISAFNFRGVYDSTHNYNYQNGEIVWHNGYWWERVDYNDKRVPGEGFGWKRLTKEYTAPRLDAPNNYYSSYEKGDIVIYNNYYYRAKQNVLENNGGWGFVTDTQFWERLGIIDDPEVIEIVKQNTYDKKDSFVETLKKNIQYKGYTQDQIDNYINDFKNNFILSKYMPKNIDWSDITRKDFSLFDSTKLYSDNDIVKVPNKIDSTFYDLYIKKTNFSSNLPPNNPASGWIKLDFSFDEGSSYLKNDVVLYASTGDTLYLKAKRDILLKTDPYNDIYNNKIDWGNLYP